MTDRLLVLGGRGMLGHVLVQQAAARGLDVHWTSRDEPPDAAAGCITRVDVTRPHDVARVLEAVQPTTVINCVGAVKQRHEVSPTEMIRVNALFPHELLELCAPAGTRVIQLSTDCVFAGVPGDRADGYSEDDRPDPTDVYGRSKLLGELDDAGATTVRTSMIGPEIGRGLGLLAWFLEAPAPIRGFTDAWFSGLTTVELSRVLLDVVLPRPALTGVWHVAGPPISKHDLLMLLRARWRPDVPIAPDATVHIDRRLDGRRFVATTGYTAPAWEEMVDSMQLTKGHAR